MKKEFFIILQFFIISYCNTIQDIFIAQKAGTWYPADKSKLNKFVENLFKLGKDEFYFKTDEQKIRALIAPHAGYIYSGKIAAAVYNLIKNKKVDHIMILGPSHFVQFNGINLPLFEKYQTPLGTLNIDNELLEKLKNKPFIKFDNNVFLPEHSIEMELPFIQTVAPNIKIIPIIVGQISDEELKSIAQNLKSIITKNTLLIISTDFTHFGKSFNYIPFNKNILLNIKQLDSKILNPIQHQNLKNFENIMKSTQDTVCGYNPLRILLELINQNVFGKVTTRLVAYGTSFDKSKDEKNIVSYAGLIVTNELNNVNLNKFEQDSLLKYSRNILEQAFKKTIDENLLKPIMTLLIEKPQSVFPTLWTINKKGKKELRGCIGRIYSDKPLYQTLKETTLDSAFKDSRFLPLKEEELKNIIIEISVLRKPKPIKSYKDIILNKHGIILTNGDKSALFLPTVPKEFGFDLKQTLEELSLKAGLGKNAWNLPTTKFQVFEAQNFEENHRN